MRIFKAPKRTVRRRLADLDRWYRPRVSTLPASNATNAEQPHARAEGWISLSRAKLGPEL